MLFISVCFDLGALKLFNEQRDYEMSMQILCPFRRVE